MQVIGDESLETFATQLLEKESDFDIKFETVKLLYKIAPNTLENTTDNEIVQKILLHIKSPYLSFLGNTVEFYIKKYEIFTAYYSISFVLVYLLLAILSYLAIKKHYNSKHFLHRDVLIKSNHTVGISVIAPAFNEAATIVYNVKSLLAQQYPKYEVIIVNDGSTDDSLEKMIKEFSLVKVDFFYQEKIPTQPVKGHYKSTNPLYSKLLVVDKVNGGSKADASNAGINSAQIFSFSMYRC